MKELIVDLTNREEGEDNPEVVDFENVVLDSIGKIIRVRITTYHKSSRHPKSKPIGISQAMATQWG